ncbi:sigma-70 domain-containing protein [Streptomyces sp. NPDC057094]|uniref:sigma-70 domain-containing protein n=1 Tax=Streptomyces sp. NPDC057094 TaxID=3346018 RepID=UPI0036416E51
MDGPAVCPAGAHAHHTQHSCGTIGLIKAIDRFELTREVEFTSFAVPHIVGEIKRFFRDTTWAVHVPRRLQEARVALAKATEEHRSRLGRMPTTRELSALMSLSERDVIEARKAANGYTSTSLEAAITSSEDDEAALADFIGVDVRAASPAPPPAQRTASSRCTTPCAGVRPRRWTMSPGIGSVAGGESPFRPRRHRLRRKTCRGSTAWTKRCSGRFPLPTRPAGTAGPS